MIRTEVLIIGGGPAGAACAKRLRELGEDCLILDKQAFPRTKPCAGWVTPQVFQYLQVDPKGYPHSLTHFDSFQVAIKGIRFRLPTHQFAIRRVEFDAWLLELAGTEPIQHRATRINQTDKGFVVDEAFQGRYIVGAGGTHCPVRRQFFPEHTEKKHRGLILAKEAEFPYPAINRRCHLWFFQDGLPGYAWYVPKAGGYLNIGIGASAHGLRRKNRTLNDYWEKHLAQMNHLGLIDPPKLSPQGYSYYLRQKEPGPQSGRVLLVGDSLGLATRDMGEGIGPAIQSGIMAAEAIHHQASLDTRSIARLSFPSLVGWRR